MQEKKLKGKRRQEEERRRVRRRSDQLTFMHEFIPTSNEIEDFSEDVQIIIREIYSRRTEDDLTTIIYETNETVKEENKWKTFIRKTALAYGRYYKIDKSNDKRRMIISCICKKCNVQFAFDLKTKDIFIREGKHLSHQQEKKDIINHRKKIPYQNEINQLPKNDVFTYFHDETEQ